MFHHPAGQQSSAARFPSCLGSSLSEGISRAALEISRVLLASVPATFTGTTSEELRLETSKVRHLACLENLGFFPRCFPELLWLLDSFHFSNSTFSPPGLLWPSLILLSFLGASNLLLEPFTCFSDQRMFQSEFGKKLFLVSLYQKHVALCYQTTLPSSFLARFIQICTQPCLK